MGETEGEPQAANNIAPDHKNSRCTTVAFPFASEGVTDDITGLPYKRSERRFKCHNSSIWSSFRPRWIGPSIRVLPLAATQPVTPEAFGISASNAKTPHKERFAGVTVVPKRADPFSPPLNLPVDI